jgi:pimeloyl-ACP methyl ester carboxylesterase
MQNIVTTVDGARIAYHVWGERGPVILCIHGWCCNSTFWDAQVEALSGRFRVVTLDLAGHGASPPADRSAYTMEAFGRDVLAVADAIDAERCVLIGHSMGGPVAIEAALHLGDRCSLIIGIDTFTEGGFYRRQPRAEIDQRMAYFAADFDGAMRRMIQGLVADRDNLALIDQISGQMHATDLRAALAALDGLLDWDIEARWPLSKARAETINSAVLGPRNHIDLPGLAIHLIDGAGHFPMQEAPARLNAMLAGILDRHEL